MKCITINQLNSNLNNRKDKDGYTYSRRNSWEVSLNVNIGDMYFNPSVICVNCIVEITLDETDLVFFIAVRLRNATF